MEQEVYHVQVPNNILCVGGGSNFRLLYNLVGELNYFHNNNGVFIEYFKDPSCNPLSTFSNSLPIL